MPWTELPSIVNFTFRRLEAKIGELRVDPMVYAFGRDEEFLWCSNVIDHIEYIVHIVKITIIHLIILVCYEFFVCLTGNSCTNSFKLNVFNVFPYVPPILFHTSNLWAIFEAKSKMPFVGST